MATPTSLFISIGSQRCTAARIVAQDTRVRVESVANREFPVDQGSEVARAAQTAVFIEELSAELGSKKGEPVRIILSAQHVYTKWVSVPRLEGHTTEQIIELEAKQEIPFPLESVCWSYWHSDDEMNSDEALVAAVRRELVDQISAATEAAGLDLACIELSPFALRNAYLYNYSESEQSQLIVDFGAKVTSLIFLEGSKFYLRTPSVGGSNLSSQLAREMGMEVTEAEQVKLEKGVVGLAGYQVAQDEEQEMISKILRTAMTRLQTEITRTLSVWRSQQGGSAPEKIYLSGGSAALPYALEFLEEKMNISLDYFNAFHSIEIAESISEDQRASLSYLVGDLIGSALSANSLVRDHLTIVPEVVYQKQEARRQQPFFIGSLVLLLLGFVALIASNLVRKSNAEEVITQNNSSVNEVEKYDAQIKKLMNTESSSGFLDGDAGHLELERLASTYQGLVDRRSYWVNFLDDFNQRFDSDVVWLTGWSLNYYFFDEQGQVILNDMGVAESASAESAIEEISRSSKVRKIPAVGTLSIEGLYRGDSRLLVFNEYEDLKEQGDDQPWLKFNDFSGKEIKIDDIETFSASENYGASFSVTLPLARPLPVDPLISFAQSEDAAVEN